MTIRLLKLLASGPGKPDARIDFDEHRCLIRGPSDTGKSHIRECLHYLLGGERAIKKFPENEGYDTLTLEFQHLETSYVASKAIAGGVARITKQLGDTSEVVDQDIGELLVELSGAKGKQIVRSKSAKGAVTGGDLRHWFLISQTEIISDHPTYGQASGVDRIQRAAAFYLFLTGMDDAAVILAKTRAERDSISGQIYAAESAIARAGAGLPEGTKKEEVVDAIERVDIALAEITRQYEARAKHLRGLRQETIRVATELSRKERLRIQSQAMVHRFSLLDEKYQSDLDRLDATDEGIAYFDALHKVPCPLCNTPVEEQVSQEDLKPRAPSNYRSAIRAEADKIRALRIGLKESQTHEVLRFEESKNDETKLRNQLEELEQREKIAINGLKVEFSSDPRELALRRSELSSQLNLLEDIERLRVEIDHLKNIRRVKASPVSRVAIEPAKEVAEITRELLLTWGFSDVERVELDSETCDLVINGRPRLSYGAGRRAICLAALTVALLKNSLARDRPHIGFVVIDSPIKSYADPKGRDANDVAPTAVRDNFFAWLSRWNGPGQVIVLENEEVTDPEIAAALHPIEFSGRRGEGRTGFYPSLPPAGNEDEASRPEGV